MPDPKEGRQWDPRGLSEKTPGRSKIQDEAPSLTPRDIAERRHEEERERTFTQAPATEADLERREARGLGAMPYGVGGSRRGRPAGGTVTPEDRMHSS